MKKWIVFLEKQNGKYVSMLGSDAYIKVDGRLSNWRHIDYARDRLNRVSKFSNSIAVLCKGKLPSTLQLIANYAITKQGTISIKALQCRVCVNE